MACSVPHTTVQSVLKVMVIASNTKQGTTSESRQVCRDRSSVGLGKQMHVVIWRVQEQPFRLWNKCRRFHSQQSRPTNIDTVTTSSLTFASRMSFSICCDDGCPKFWCVLSMSFSMCSGTSFQLCQSFLPRFVRTQNGFN